MKEGIYSSEIYQSLKFGVNVEKKIVGNTLEAFKPIFYIMWLRMVQNLRSNNVG